MPNPAPISRRRALQWGGLAGLLLSTAACSRAGATTAAAGSAPAGPQAPHSVPMPEFGGLTASGFPPSPTASAPAPGHAPTGSASRAAPIRPLAAAPAGHPRSSARRGSMPPTGGPLWSAPVYSLGQYTAHFPQTHFPSDAIMLTIDDGPDPTWTPKILRLLARYDVPATFCVIGEQARSRPTLVRAAASEGHHLANHSFSHPLALPNLRPAQIAAEVLNTQDAIVRAAGVTPRLFRSPGGNWGRRLYSELATRSLVPLDWDVDPRDWARPGTAQVTSALLAARPGQIVLCHDGGGDRSQTYAALAAAIPRLKARGLRFVTLPS